MPTLSVLARRCLAYPAQVSDDEHQRPAAVPKALVVAVALLRLEVLALIGTAIVLVVLSFTRTTTRLWAALTIAAFALLAAVVLWLCSRGLLALRAGASTPALLLELLALPVTYSLGFQAGRPLIAVPIMVAALAVIALLLSAPARRALDREP
jgi:predicted metallopeptidase